MIEPTGGRKLGVSHYAGMIALGAVGGVLALVLFIWIVGAIFRFVEIAAVVALIALGIWFLVRRALR